MIKKIIILDFTDGTVLVTDIDTSRWSEAEDFIVDRGMNIRNCQYMVIDKINLTIE